MPLITEHPRPTRLTPPSGKVVGTVVDMQDDATIAGDRQLMALNLGTANGITPGSLFVIYKVMYPSVPTPRIVLGEAVVVAVRERTATVRIMNSNDAIMPGDKAELRREHTAARGPEGRPHRAALSCTTAAQDSAGASTSNT